MSKQITAVYQDRKTAANAIERLQEECGVTADDISVLVSEATRGREFQLKEESKAPEGVASGAAAGGALGALAASLMAVGAVAAPGVGLLAAGPIVAALAGAGAGGTVGGIIGGLVGLGIPEHTAKAVSEELKRGALLIGVLAHEERSDRIKKVLKETGGQHIR